MFYFRRSKRGVDKMELNILNMISNMKVKQEQQKYNILVNENIPPKNNIEIEDLSFETLSLKNLDKSEIDFGRQNNVFIIT